MKGDLPAGVQLLNLVAHVLEEQAALLRVHLQASLQQAEQEPHPARRYQTLQHIHSPSASTAAEHTTRGTSGRSEQGPESLWAKYMDHFAKAFLPQRCIASPVVQSLLQYNFIAKCQYNCSRNVFFGAKYTHDIFTLIIKHH